MNEPAKTLAFVITAAVLVGGAVASHFANQPKIVSDFELVGTPFFEQFTSSDAAKSLEVSAIDPDTLSLQQFSVKNENGLWRIPSHHNYPAEAAARLAQTATSVIGIERESLAGRLASEHEKLGVVDPLSTDEDSMEDPAAAGKRITIKDGAGEVLVDYIIGKKAGDAPGTDDARSLNESRPADYYFVRRPDEQQTYKVKLNIDLSTKFSDWIDPDLLRLDRSKLVRLEVDNYKLTEDRNSLFGQVKSLTKEQGDQFALSRASSTDAWKLADLKPETEELALPRVNEIINVLGEIKIVGVRPKFKYKDHLLLTPELKLNTQPEFRQNPQEFGAAVQKLQNELEDRGFSLAGTSEKLELVSTNGELAFGTSEGLQYRLQVGKEVEGKDKAIEIGDESETSESAKTDSDSEAAKKPAADAQSETVIEDPEVVDEAAEKNHYLMIRVAFDESLLGEKPIKPIQPTAPTQPDGYTPPPTDSGLDKEDATASETNEDAPPTPNVDGEKDETSTDSPVDRKAEFIAHDEELASYEQAKVDFELATSRYSQDVKAFEAKVGEGKKLVDELNERFGDWYYVISATNLKTLQTERKELVTIKEVPPEALPESLPSKPDISFPETPDLK